MTKQKLKISRTNKFIRQLRKLAKQGKDMKKLNVVVDLLVSHKKLPKKYQDHALKGKFKGARDCHIEPDWILIYEVYNDILILDLLYTGTHSEMF